MSFDKINLKEKFTERELIAGISGNSNKIDRVGALLHLLQSNSKKKQQIVKETIQDTKQPYDVRLMAINEIARNPTKENTAILLSQISSKDDRVLSKTFRVLGEMGDENVLKELQKVKVNSSSYAAEKLDFAKKLIAYKIRSSSETLSTEIKGPILKVNGKTAQPFTLKPLVKRQISETIAVANSRLNGLEISDKLITHIQCGNDEMSLAFTKEFDNKRGVQTLSSKKGIPMVMLKKRGCPEMYTVSHYFFATPGKNKNSFDLKGVKPSGIVTFTGTVAEGKEGFEVSLKSVQNLYEAGINFEAVVNHEEQYFKPKVALSNRQIEAGTNLRKIPTKAKLPE